MKTGRAVGYLLVLAATAAACGGSTEPKVELDTREHATGGLTWTSTAMSAGLRWRYLYSVRSEPGVSVSGTYEITFYNPTSATICAGVSKLAFEDSLGLQVAAVEPTSGQTRLFSRCVSPGLTGEQTGNFALWFPALEAANGIKRVGIWASFW